VRYRQGEARATRNGTPAAPTNARRAVWSRRAP